MQHNEISQEFMYLFSKTPLNGNYD